MHTRLLMVTAALVLACLSAACTHKVVYKEASPKPVIVEDEGNGPPPHAPANGYRRNHDNVVLVYDSGIDVYVVSGHRDCYYSSGQYFRFVDGSWEWSVSFESGWKIVASFNDVPSGLRAKHGNGHGHKGKGKGHDKH
jgi:hypothetical protein